MKTLGEKRVRTEFNPSSEDYVQIIKNKGADFINFLQAVKNEVSVKYSDMDPKSFNISFGELFRLISIAQTDIETATMYGVKAATYKPEY